MVIGFIEERYASRRKQEKRIFDVVVKPLPEDWDPRKPFARMTSEDECGRRVYGPDGLVVSALHLEEPLYEYCRPDY